MATMISKQFGNSGHLVKKGLIFGFACFMAFIGIWLTGCSSSKLNPTSASSYQDLNSPLTATVTSTPTSTVTSTPITTSILILTITPTPVVTSVNNNNLVCFPNGPYYICTSGTVVNGSSNIYVEGGNGGNGGSAGVSIGTLSVGNSASATLSLINSNDGGSATITSNQSMTVTSSTNVTGGNATGPGGNGGNAVVNISGNLVITSSDATVTPTPTP